MKEKEKEKRGKDGKEKEKTKEEEAEAKKAAEMFTIQLRNAIGAVVDVKTLPLTPKYVAMSSFHAAVANDRTVYTWQFQSQVRCDVMIVWDPITTRMLRQVNKTGLGNASTANMLSGATSDPSGSSSSGGGRAGQAKLRMFDITNTSFSTAQSPETFQISTEAIADPICCITISDKYMMVGRKSGTLTRFNLPHLTPENTYTLRDREPHRIDFNCTSTKLSLIDSNGVFTILDLEARVSETSNSAGGVSASASTDEKGTDSAAATGPSAAAKMVLGPYYGKRLNVERKDVWDMKWSEDDPDMLVIMEKTKMVVFHGEVAEDPVVSSGYLARFQDLEIRVVAMDDLMMHPDKTSRQVDMYICACMCVFVVVFITWSDGLLLLRAGIAWWISSPSPCEKCETR